MYKEVRTIQGLKRFILLLFLLGWASFVFAEEGLRLDVSKKNSLILIGYFDDVGDRLLFDDYKFHFSISKQVEKAVFDHLNMTGYSFKSSGIEGLTVFANSDAGKQVYFFNVNSRCPDDKFSHSSIGSIIRKLSAQLCDSQMKKINFAHQLLASEVKKFDEFYYIGHSRVGNGLAIGPYLGRYTFPVALNSQFDESTDSSEQLISVNQSAFNWINGRLKTIKLLSCKSEFYYQPILARLGFNFVGFDDSLEWNTDSKKQNTLLIAIQKHIIDD